MTENRDELKKKATEFRKSGQLIEALPIFKTLASPNGDKYDHAGLLHCLRKLGQFEEALPLADKLIKEYPNYPWCKTEVTWTYIQGELDKLAEDAPLKTVLSVANKVMSINPEAVPTKMVVFRVLRAAKSANNWNTINEWIEKLNPDSLSAEPMVIGGSGKRGWSERAQWYNYKIRGLIEDGKFEDAICLVDRVVVEFPQQKKYFYRLKALAYYQGKNLQEAEKIYRELCGGFKTDWWLLHAYAKVLRDKGQSNEALELMCRAANSHSKYDAMVKLFADMGFLCKTLGKNAESRAHLCLSKLIREENKWSVDASITNGIEELNIAIGNGPAPSTIREALNICRETWRSAVKVESQPSKQIKPRKSLIGKVSFGKEDKPFCFISIDGSKESVICFKKDLPSSIKHGDTVTFTATPSFDKKKQKDSWRAIEVTACKQ